MPQEQGWREAAVEAEARVALPVAGPEADPEPEPVQEVGLVGDVAPESDQSAAIRRLKTALIVVSALLVLALAVLAGIRFQAPWARGIAPVVTAVRMPDGQIGPVTAPSTSVAADGSTTISVPQFGSVTLPAGVTSHGYNFYIDENGGQSLALELDSGVMVFLGWVNVPADSPEQLQSAADQWASGWQATYDSPGAMVTSPHGDAGWCVQTAGGGARGCFYLTATRQISCYIMVTGPSDDASKAKAQALIDSYIPGV